MKKSKKGLILFVVSIIKGKFEDCVINKQFASGVYEINNTII